MPPLLSFPLPPLPLPSPGGPPVPLPSIPLPEIPLPSTALGPMPVPAGSPLPPPADGTPGTPGTAPPGLPSSRFDLPSEPGFGGRPGAPGPAPLGGGGVNPGWASEPATGGMLGSASPYGPTTPVYGSAAPVPAHSVYRAQPGTVTLLPLAPPPDVAALPKVWAYSGSPSRRPSPPRVALVLGVALLVLAGALGFVLTHHQAPARAFAMSLARGERLRYRVRFQIDATQRAGHDARPLHAVTSTLRSWRVLKVDPKGVATVLERSTVESATLDGHPLKASKKATKARLRIAPEGGLLVGTSGLLVGNGQAVPAFGGFGPVLPDHPVRSGDEWDLPVAESLPGGGSIHGTLHATLLRYETQDGLHVAVVASSLTLPLDFTTNLARDRSTARVVLGRDLRAGEAASLREKGRITVEQTVWFDPATGRVVRGSMSGHLDVRTTVSVATRALTPVSLIGDFSISTIAVAAASPSPAKG